MKVSLSKLCISASSVSLQQLKLYSHWGVPPINAVQIRGHKQKEASRQPLRLVEAATNHHCCSQNGEEEKPPKRRGC